MGIFDFLRSSVRQQETVSDVQEERTALSDLQQYVRSNSSLGSHASERDAAGGTGLRLPEFGGKNLAETAPISAEAEGKTLEQIADGKRISKTMEQYEGEYRRLQNGFERNFYDGSAGRTEKAELGKQYCQNVNAICEMRDREKTLGHELDGVKNQMAAMHMDHPNGFSTADQAKYESLLGRRRQLESDISRLGSMEYQLEGNNRSIAGWLGERYVPVVDLPQYNKEQTVSNLEKHFEECERKLEEGKALPRDAYAFAATQNYMKDALNQARGIDVNGSRISDERIDRALAKSEALSEAYKDTFRDHKFLPDGTYSQYTEKNRTGSEVLSWHSAKTDEDGFTSVTKTDTGLLKGNLSYSADLQAKKAAAAANASVLENSFQYDREKSNSEIHIKGGNRLGYADVSAEGSVADLRTGRLRVSAEWDLAKGNINVSGGSKEKDGLTFEASAEYAAGQKKAGADIDAAKWKADITNSEKDFTAKFNADVNTGEKAPVMYAAGAGKTSDTTDSPVRTKIDSSVHDVEQDKITNESVKNSFADGNYRTVVADRDIDLYRVFDGHRARSDGSFFTTEKPVDRIAEQNGQRAAPGMGKWKDLF